LRRPPLRWLCNEYYRTAGTTALAHAIAHEPNLISACQATSRLVELEFIARPYHYASQLLEAGQPPHEAFYRAGLLSRQEFRELGLDFDDSNPSWSLRCLAQWKVERMLRRYSMLIQCLLVFVTLILAAIVGGLAVGMFQTLTTMIESLS
jgi:type II secretory pathway component PulF